MRAKLILFCVPLLVIPVLTWIQWKRAWFEALPRSEMMSGGLKPMISAKVGGGAKASTTNGFPERQITVKSGETSRLPAAIRTSQIAAAASRFKVGERWNYKGFTLMRIQKNDLITDDEIQFIKEEWNNAVKSFIVHDLGLGESTFQEYLQARQAAFIAYDALVVPIQREISEKFGTQIQLIHGEESWNLYETSSESYRTRLKAILGSNGLAHFEEFRNQFGAWVFQKFNVGWNDLR